MPLQVLRLAHESQMRVFQFADHVEIRDHLQPGLRRVYGQVYPWVQGIYGNQK